MNATVNEVEGVLPLSSHSRGIGGCLVRRTLSESQSYWEVPEGFPSQSHKTRSTNSGEGDYILLVTSGPPFVQVSLGLAVKQQQQGERE